MAKRTFFVLVCLGIWACSPAINVTYQNPTGYELAFISTSTLDELFQKMEEGTSISATELWDHYRHGSLTVQQTAEGVYEISSSRLGGSLTLVLLDDAA